MARPAVSAVVFFFAVVTMAGSAYAQPDVIVGDLMDVANYGSASNIAAFAVGTESCNIGNLPLSWVANTNQHPVIGQSMYRLKDGRFEQVGRSWLKHGFTALALSLCSPCQNPGTGSLLGVGCSDPYVATLNGTQSSLGPATEVNPATGVYVYPFTSPSYSGVLARRLQVAHVDLDPTQNAGARYFVQGQYIHPQDAAAGNDNNNASYREIAVSPNGTSYNIGLLSSTQRMRPGIQAWADVDPLVSIANVDIPNDGRVVVAYKATPLLNGLVHHEFAVQNLNSDRSISGFIVPLPAGATVQNIGFHDVNYHSSEPFPGATGAYSGSDWVGVITSTGIAWQTETAAANQRANAIRWGSLFNFRFDTNVQPGNPVLEIFKPGTPTSVIAPVMPQFSIAVVGGAPVSITAGQSATVDFQVTNLAGAPNASTAQIFASVNGGTTTSSPLSSLGGNLFRGTLPSANCFDSIDWYVSIAPTGGGSTVYFPIGGASGPFRTEALTPVLGTVVSETFDAATAPAGWAVTNGAGLTDGAWDAAPAIPGNFGAGDPPAAQSGNRCWVTKNVANADVDGGETRLTSPSFDLLGYPLARVSVWVWFDNDNLGANVQDTLQVQISANNGTSWTTMESISQSPNAWVQRKYRVAQYVTPTAAMRVRFIASDYNPAALVEAAIDGFKVEISPIPPYLGPAATGNVGAAVGGPYNVININGTAGSYERRFSAALGQPLIVDVLQPPSSAAPAIFSLYGFVGVPTLGQAVPLPLGLGTFAFTPCPLDPFNPLNFTLVDGIGIGFCAPIAPAGPTPYTAVIPGGITTPVDITVQGLIADPSAPLGFSVTNAMILHVQ